MTGFPQPESVGEAVCRLCGQGGPCVEIYDSGPVCEDAEACLDRYHARSPEISL